MKTTQLTRDLIFTPIQLNSFNQQYNPYSSLSSNYQWPTGANGQFVNQQYSPLSNYLSSQVGSSAFPGMSGSSSQNGASSILSGLDGSSSQPQQSANSNNAGSNGLLSSASHLIAQYLSPSSTSNSATSGQQQPIGQNSINGQAQQNLISPQQQSQYNEFASILDSMVAQTGPTAQRQPAMNQYMNAANGVSGQSVGQQALQSQQGYQAAPGNLMGSSGTMMGDNEMSGSSNIQSYMPATQQQASQKSSMVSLAEQLAPGAQFNKLVSFPFSLTNNDDPSKEGRFKLHIPFLNQHVKRSDQPQQVSQTARQQQILNQYYSQQQALANQQGQQQQMTAQASQVIPTIVSPQSSVSQSQSSESVANSAPSAAVPASQSSSVVSSVSSSSSSSSVQQSAPSMLSQTSSGSATNSVAPSSNQVNRPSWSVSDLQSGQSASKLIPMPSYSPSADAAVPSREG